jgi:glycosyltransferase involved in cell wall biosynthesis
LSVLPEKSDTAPSKATEASRPRKVLYLDHTAKIGGGEVALLGLIAALDRSRYTPIVALASDGPLADRLRSAGVETHVLPLAASVVETRKEATGLRALLRGGQAWHVARYAARVARLARTLGADLIHTNSLKADLYGGLAGRLARIPTLWHVRDRIGEGYLPGPAAAAFRLLARALPQGVVFNSDSSRQCLRVPPSARFDVVHDGCDPDVFGLEDERAVASLLDEPIVVLVGRITPWKGQHVFVAAAARVLERFPKARFQIVGSPLFGEHEYEASIRRQVQDLGVAERVEFLGFRDDVPAVLAQSSVVVHASTHGEPFGQVVIEGMAAGKPVVATDGGALPEIIEDGVTGLLVPMGDAEAMAEAIERLLSDPVAARTMGLAGQTRVRECFTLRQTAHRMQQVYDRMLDNP